MATFTDEELLFLSNLMYVKEEDCFKSDIWSGYNEDEPLHETIGERLERTLVGDTSKMTDEEIDEKWNAALKKMIDQQGKDDEHLYDGHIGASEWPNMLNSIRNSELANLKVEKVLKDKTGSLSACLTDSDGNAYVVFRGTARGEWRDNFEGGYETDTEQQRRALDFINSLDEDFKNITVVGHSKGGNKAKYVALLSDRVDRCVSFDGQGFSQEFIQKYGNLIEKNEYKITNYALDNDFVNLLMYDIGKKIYIKGNGVSSYAQNHSPNSFFHYDSNGKYKPFEEITVSETVLTTVLHGFVCYVLNTASDDDKESLLDFLGGLLANTMGNENEDGEFDILNYFFCMENAEEVGILLAYLARYVVFDEYALDTICEWIGSCGIEGKIIAYLLPILIEHLDKKSHVDDILKLLIEGLDSIMWLFGYLGIDINSVLLKIIDVAHDKSEMLPCVRTNVYEYKNSSTKRVFTEEMRMQLLEICKEVENEPWYDVSRWDVWYRGERWFNRLTIDNYVNNINEYYRKCIDINDENEASINKIFDEVYNVDSHYAKIISEENDKIKSLSNSIKTMLVKI